MREMGRGGGLKLLSDLRKVYMWCVYVCCVQNLRIFCHWRGPNFLFTSKLFFVLHAFYGGPPCFIHSFIHELYVYDPPSTSTPILVDL